MSEVTPDAAANGDAVENQAGPSGFLGEIIGAPVTVKLNSGITYQGIDLPARVTAQNC